MDKAQRAGVESLARTNLETIADELLILRVDGPVADIGSTIPFIVEERMADMAHVHADLVRAARLQDTLHHRYESEALQDPVVRYGVFALLGVGVHPVTEPVVGVAADVPVNGSLVLADVPPHNGGVFPFDGMVEKLLGQMHLRLVVLRHHQQAGGIFVDPMYQDPRPFVTVGHRQAQIVSQGIHQRAVKIPVSRMHHHPGRLVHHQYVLVFIDDIQRNVLRDDIYAAAAIRHHEPDHIAGADDDIRLGEFPVHEDITGLDGALDAVTGRILQVG